jgi:hypothetical protein
MIVNKKMMKNKGKMLFENYILKKNKVKMLYNN